MAFYLVQGGSTLYQMTTAGVSTGLTLPTGVTLDSARRLRGTVLGNLAVLVNSPSTNISVDRYQTIRLLCPTSPSGTMTLSAVAGGSLTGTWNAKTTFRIKDSYGNLLAESGFSPTSADVSPSTQAIRYAGIPVSSESITSRQIYRPTTGPGSTYYPLLEVEGNTVTTVDDALADASLSLVSTETDLGTPPRFSQIAAWRNRLWGVPFDEIDTLRFSGNGRIFAWASTQNIPIPPPGFDRVGITGLMARRDELGVGKQNAIHKITGTSPTNFTRYTVVEGIGVWATDSISVIHDVAYFLGNPFGIYTWGPGNVTNITDAKVKSWFATDTYFNRAKFDDAVGAYDPISHRYVLFLAAAGSTDLDRWIEYDIASGTWWGPHLTGAFTTTGCLTVLDANDIGILSITGGDGKLYKYQSTYTDATSTAIDMDVHTSFMSANTPDIEKYFGELSIISGIEAGGTLTITPSVGGLNASAGAAISHDLTTGRENLRRLGTGRFCQLNLRVNTNTRGARIYGLEIPYHELGRR